MAVKFKTDEKSTEVHEYIVEYMLSDIRELLFLSLHAQLAPRAIDAREAAEAPIRDRLDRFIADGGRRAMMCGLKDENCSARVTYRANFEDREGLAAVWVPLCGAHAVACENAGRKVVPLVHRMWEGGTFA